MPDKQKAKKYDGITLLDVLNAVKKYTGVDISQLLGDSQVRAGYSPAGAGLGYGIGTPRSMSRDDEAMYGVQTGDYAAASPSYAGEWGYDPMSRNNRAPLPQDDKWSLIRRTRPIPTIGGDVRTEPTVFRMPRQYTELLMGPTDQRMR